MRILLFGHSGQVARTFLEEASAHDVVALGRSEVDLLRPGAATEAANANQPEVIVNAAAYTAVDKAETESQAAGQLNAIAVGEMAEAAKVHGAHFIHLSTDYVFDGRKAGAYTENDPTGPLNVYGVTKLDGEKRALDAFDQTVVLRTSWVFSEYGANFVKSMLRSAATCDALDVVADQVGGPTPARDIARAILAIAGKKHRGAPGAGVYHYQGAPPASWAEFATKIFEYAGRSIEVRPIKTADFPRPAARPLNTVLDCARIERNFGLAQPDWRIGLRQVVAALTAENP